MTTGTRRVLLGRTQTLAGRSSVHAVPDGIEIDESDHGYISRKRVFFDDVLMVTYHRFVGTWFVALVGGATALFLLMALGLFSSRNGEAGGIALLLFALVFGILLVLRLVFRVDAVTVYGKRTKAEMHFWFRKRKARSAYDEIRRRAREAQEALAARLAAEPPPPVEEAVPAPPAEAPPATDQEEPQMNADER